MTAMLRGVCLVCLAVLVRTQGQLKQEDRDVNKAAASLRTRIEATPRLPLHGVRFSALPPTKDWQSGTVSGVAINEVGDIYEIQRGDEADPILILNTEGKVLRSWGKGDFKLPHSIRLDPAGNIWTVDAASSMVIKYSPLGKKLMIISVGGQPENGSPFNGTTDLAFSADGRLFITDGYGNARVLEYTADGRRLRIWGRPGSGPGDLHLPHAIQIDERGTVYVADRENGRIEEFSLEGKYVGEIGGLGRVYSLKLAGGVLWASMGAFNNPPGSPGWIVKLDLRTGKMLGHLDVPEPLGGHAIEVLASGEPIITLGNGLLWFKAN